MMSLCFSLIFISLAEKQNHFLWQEHIVWTCLQSKLCIVEQIYLMSFELLTFKELLLRCEGSLRSSRLDLVISCIPEHEVHGVTAENEEGDVNVATNLEKIIVVVQTVLILLLRIQFFILQF